MARTAEMTKDNRSSVVRRLLPRHFMILDMVMAGHNNTVIAETFGMGRDTITALQRSPIFQAEIVRRRKEDPTTQMMSMDREAILGKARSILEQSAGDAALKHVELLETDDPALQHRAATSILDRVFGKSGDNTSTAPVVSLNAEHVELLVLAMKESDNAHPEVPATNSEAACPAENGQGDVQKGSEAGLTGG